MLSGSSGFPGGHDRAFTLVEILAVIAIVALLLGLSIAALSNTRRNTVAVLDLAGLRDDGAIITAYSGNRDGRVPARFPERDAAGEPRDMVQIDLPEGGWVISPYFSHAASWRIVAYADGFIDDRVSLPADYLFGTGSDRELTTLSHAFLAQPAYWSGDPAAQVKARWRIMRLTEVSLPALKALVVGTKHRRPRAAGVSTGFDEASEFSSPLAAVFVDGHAENVQPERFGPCVVNMLHGRGTSRPMLTTKNGVHGKDVGSES